MKQIILILALLIVIFGEVNHFTNKMRLIQIQKDHEEIERTQQEIRLKQIEILAKLKSKCE